MDKKEKLEKLTKRWDSLTLANDYIFSKVMRDKEICKEVLELLLPFKIKDIKYLEYQKNIDIQHNAKSIRLDIYVEDDDRIYNIEMQVAEGRDLVQRSRYYQSLVDLNHLERGQAYSQLKPSYIIFLCMFDPFKLNSLQYTFQNTCVEHPSLILEDGTQKIFFNVPTYNQGDDERLKSFFAYLNGNNSTNDDPFIAKLMQKVEDIKNNQKWRSEFMEFDLYGMEKFHMGEVQGEHRKQLEIARNMLEDFDDNKIATITGLPPEQVHELRQESLSMAQ